VTKRENRNELEIKEATRRICFRLRALPTHRKCDPPLINRTSAYESTMLDGRFIEWFRMYAEISRHYIYQFTAAALPALGLARSNVKVAERYSHSGRDCHR
jgi:hypothetical protein